MGRTGIFTAMIVIGTVGLAFADVLPAPKGDVVLTISGKIAEPNAGSDIAMDLEQIKGVGNVTVETTTDWDWHDGAQTFQGAPAVDVLKAAGVTNGTIKITAIDEYSIDMPIADLAVKGAIFATNLNGTDLTEESFGPLWLIFPYDKAVSPEERQTMKDRSVWSIVKIETVE